MVKSESSWTGWLVRDNNVVLASVEVPISMKAKMRGLIGRNKIEGAMYFEGAKFVHTFGMRFTLDIAFVSSKNEVIRTLRLKPNRIIFPVIRSAGIIEAAEGAFSEWDLQIGQIVETKR